jgi:UDP-N-acetylmuramoyl-tripeptide--D-alanyl-D-alanine ligase
VIPLALDEIERLAPGRLERASWAAEVTGVQVDSRRIAEGDLFVAVGAGADFCKHAFARGAAATLVPNDAFAALAALGGAVRDKSTARVVGITGSMGKTSTKDLLAALCAPSAKTIAAEASFNNEIGVPLTLCRVEHDTEICVLELSMRGFGQIAELCAFAKPEIGVITNVGPVHLELVDSLDGVIRAKSELVAALPPGGTAILPEDFPVERDDIEVIRVASPDVVVEGERTTVGAVSFNFTASHQAANAAAALAALDALGLPRPDRVDVDFSRWRGEEHELPGGGLLINDAYNANPVSMRAALQYLAARSEGRRRVAILGDMAELGRTAPDYHREVGEAAAAAGVDELLAVGELARGYVEGAGSVPARSVPNVHEALRELDALVRPGDVVLVKGSRAMGLEAVAEALAAVTH